MTNLKSSNGTPIPFPHTEGAWPVGSWIRNTQYGRGDFVMSAVASNEPYRATCGKVTAVGSIGTLRGPWYLTSMPSNGPKPYLGLLSVTVACFGCDAPNDNSHTATCAYQPGSPERIA